MHDSAEPTFCSPTHDPVVAYPSYLKELTHPFLESTWRAASAALEHASYVEVVGYSLPSSDSAARALLLPLARRCRSREAQVVVRDKSRPTLNRWDAFLGPDADLQQKEIRDSTSA